MESLWQTARRVRGRPAPDNPPLPARRPGAPGPRAVLATLAFAAAALLIPTDYPPRRLTYPILRPDAAEIARAFLREQDVDPTGFRAVTSSNPGFPGLVAEPDHPEYDLPPWRDTGLARRYVAEAGGLEAWERAATGWLPAACWTTRLIRRDGGDEWFVAVDPRRRAVVAFWRERRGTGAPFATATAPVQAATPVDSVGRAAALALIARLGPGGGWISEGESQGIIGHPGEQVLRFHDPSRRIAEASPVLTVVLRDGAPAGYGVALRLPAGWVEEETRGTLLSGVVAALRLLLLAGLGGLGLVEVARRLAGRGGDLRAAGRVALVMVLPVLLYHLNRGPTLLERYPASVPWSVFVASSAVGLALSVLLQSLLVFLSLLALAAVRPDWRTALPPGGWRPVARPALAVVLIGLAFGVVVDRLELLGRIRWPELFPGPTPPTLPGYGAIYPFFDVAWTAVTGSFLVGGMLSLVVVLTRGPFRRRRSRVALLALVAVALGPDRARTAAEAVVPTLFEVLALLTAILLARRLARGLLPAYVVLLPLALGGQTALVLVSQPQFQARLSGVAAFALLAIPLALLAGQALRPARGIAPAAT